MKKLPLSLSTWALTLTLVTSTALGDNLLPIDSSDYYALNGGSDIAMPPVERSSSLTVGGNVDSKLGYNCTQFNPAISISNTINDIGDSIEGLSSSVIGSATSAVGALPMYLLEKADPKLYNLIENAMTGAQDTFNVSMKDCQSALGEIKQGKSPYQNWFTLSDSNNWMHHAKAAQQNQDVDINAAVTETTKTGSDEGVQWVHKGASGGKVGHQVPIKVISDVAIAGYNILIDPKRPLDDRAAPDTKSNPAITTFWPKPQDAGDFATLVLGDIKISSENDVNTQDTHAGVGLVPILTACPTASTKDRTCVKTLTGKLTQLVNSDQMPSSQDLAQVSANGVAVTAEVILTLRRKNAATQSLYESHIGEDIAMQNLVDEALLLRRMLIAGSQAQAVHALQPALDTITVTLKQLNKDIDNLLFEHNIRKEMTSNAIKTLMAEQSHNQTSSSKQENTTEPESAMAAGAVYQQDNDNGKQA